jgi:hypothetical protein
MKTAGLILDFYDDSSGSLLKESFPTSDALPDIIKEAHILTPEERDVLRNEAYALVMNNEGKMLRKFACVDPGNTAISVLYFLKNMDHLPEEAQKVAASNLVEACEEFSVPYPPFLKAAAKSPIRKRDSMQQPEAGSDADWYQRTNLSSVKGGEDSGRVISTVQNMKTAEVIDVSDKEAPVTFKKKEASNYALGNKYPLDSYADVQKAISYFSENYTEMGPEDRHEYCVKTASRATELGLEVPELMDRYGSVHFANDVEAHLASRRAVCDPEFIPVYEALSEKIASVEPEQFVQLLTEADEVANLHWLWGGQVSDPYFSTFGGYPEKDKIAFWSWQSSGGDYVSGEELKQLAINGRPLVHKHFSSGITDAFQKDPIGIFESMPEPHKIILARLASDMHDPYPKN